jgi:dihydroorotate dehydrogenase (NAD+) catalytic subunit
MSEAQGAFLTNPISLSPRSPATERALLPYPGGVLMHSGLPNPGLNRVLRRHAGRWAQSSLPVWAHLIGQDPDEIYQMVRRLEGVEGISAVEIGIPPDAQENEALAFARAAAGELPVVISVSLTAAGEPWLKALSPMGISALTFSAPRGALVTASGKPVRGRLYGPAVFPLMLAAVQNARTIGLPIIAGGGIYRHEDGQALRDAGAWAVQVDTALWCG